MNDDNNLSINNMVEMATGLSMASLFTQAMNSAFTNTVYQQNSPLNTPAKYLYAIINGQQAGPFSPGEILVQIQAGNITPETYMWKPGMMEWKFAKDITDIALNINLTPPMNP